MSHIVSLEIGVAIRRHPHGHISWREDSRQPGCSVGTLIIDMRDGDASLVPRLVVVSVLRSLSTQYFLQE